MDVIITEHRILIIYYTYVHLLRERKVTIVWLQTLRLHPLW